MTRGAIEKIIEMQASIMYFTQYLKENELIDDYYQWAEAQDAAKKIQIPERYKKSDE